ncbi:efflux RND transporter periplasmic adaptor subunit [Thermopirellula anaerolimosa]
MANATAYRSSLWETLIQYGTPPLILVLGVVGFLFLKSLRQPPAREEPPATLPVVEAAVVKPHEAGLEISGDGIVVPYREIQVAAEVDGRIVLKTPECEAGTYVKRGTLLLSIEKRDFEIEVERLKEQVKQAENSVKELDVDIENTGRLIELSQNELQIASRDYQRAETLFSSNAMTQAELDAAKRNYITAQSALMNLENQLRLKRATRERMASARDQAAVLLQKAELDLARTDIRAPADGVVVQDLVEADSYVRKGTAVLVFEDTSKAQIKCSLRVDQLAWLWAVLRQGGNAANARTTAYEVPRVPATVVYEANGLQYAWTGTLDGYEGLGLDEQTRMIPCRVLVDDPTAVRMLGGATDDGRNAVPDRAPPALLRGMYVSIRIHVSPDHRVLRLPARGIQPGGKVARIRDGRLRLVPVEVIQTLEDEAMVLASPDSLRAGDRVAVSPTPFLENTPIARMGEGVPVQEQLIP